MKRVVLALLILAGMSLFQFSCSTIPAGVVAVKNFDKARYLGTWYEIARFDFRFEKNLDNTTATYTLNENGSIKVLNKGFNYVKKKWQDAEGKAKFVDDPTVAMLKVSFFGPFYAGYNVIALDPEYRYALVAGSSTKYLWILARDKTIPEDVKQNYLEIARKAGFITDNLIWVKHD